MRLMKPSTRILRRELVRYAGSTRRASAEAEHGGRLLADMVDDLAWFAVVSGLPLTANVPRSLRGMLKARTLSFREEPIDKSTWGEGPWQHEPDREYAIRGGHFCLILRSPITGALCGYISVPQGHRLWGTDGRVFDVHGGVNFTRSDGSFWWFGFDCARAFDCSPAMEALMIKDPEVRAAIHNPEAKAPWGGRLHTYRTIEYVRAQVEGMAEQLALIEAQNEARN